jgi:L-fuconate dehydratase
MVRLAKQAVADGFKLIKLKCGVSLEDDKRRLKLAREAIGPDIKLAIDANQVWDVKDAINWINSLGDVNLHWVEEPTNPDDVVGHAAIAKAIAPVKVATGEHVTNRIIFKQMLQSKSLSFLQIDASRVAGVNENIAIILMAAKYGIPVCPHAGGVGLCEMVQHLAMFDYVAVAGEHPDRVVEFVDHLHEHFVVPTDIRNARYMPPAKAGAGAEMFAQSVLDFTYPVGKEWVEAK